jgi:hypothetical protein
MTEAATSSIQMTRAVWEAYRERYRADPWEFAVDICGLDRLVERYHKPLLYLFTHRIDLLIEVLKSDLSSPVITKIKSALKKKTLDYKRAGHFNQIERFCRKLNIRLARKTGKTSCELAAILWDITVDPNHAWALVSRDDDAAEEMCNYLVEIIQSPVYRFFFPDRLPENERISLTQSEIRLNGRTKRLPQPCVTAGGYDSGWISKHFDRIAGDDLVGLENKTPNRLKGVREFQANRNGLRIPEFDSPFLDFTTGTRWARQDDSTALDADEDCLTIYVPIETLKKNGKEVPRTLGNMMEAGEPTLPEWFNREAILAEKTGYLKNKLEGPVALLANLHLTILEEATGVFNHGVVDNSDFAWYRDDDGRLFVGRSETDATGKVLYDRNKEPRILWILVSKLEKKLGGDPASSRKGDEYGVCVMGRDEWGKRYELEMRTGYGDVGFLESIKYLKEKWDPDQIGIEAAGQQAFVRLLMSKDPSYQDFVDQIVPVPHSNVSKITRATSLVAAPLDMGEMYLDPNDTHTKQHMKDWDPDNPRSEDGCIDALGIANWLFDTPAIGYSRRDVEALAKKDAEDYRKSIDPDFGIPYETLDDGEDWVIDDSRDFDYDEAIL